MSTWRKVDIRSSSGLGDVRAFFDSCAEGYAEQHGDAADELAKRLAILRSSAQFRQSDTTLEIGCGNGLHLRELAASFEWGIGVDLSPAMIETARNLSQASVAQHRLTFREDSAEELRSIEKGSIDCAFCVGAFEHFIDQQAACVRAFEVLRPGGRLVVMTLNGGSIWYRYLAPLLRIHTRQLSTDRYLSRRDLEALLRTAGFTLGGGAAWSFVQRGDLHPFFTWTLERLDRLGRACGLTMLRGGIVVSALKPY